MNETTENFLKVMAEFEWPDPPKIFFRVYYDDVGHPITYTMEDLPGNYVDVSREDYLLASMDCRIINGKLVHPSKNITIKLRPGSLGTPCHVNDVCVVVSDDQSNIKWDIGNGSN